MTGAELMSLWRYHPANREARKHCPHCGDDLMLVAAVDIAYTLEICQCGDPEFDHLIEQLWHVKCLVEWKPTDETPAWRALEEISTMTVRGKGATPKLRYVARAALSRRVEYIEKTECEGSGQGIEIPDGVTGICQTCRARVFHDGGLARTHEREKR